MEEKLNEKILKTYFPGIFGLAPGLNRENP